MGKVRTILGDVDSSELGIVDAHEHLIRTGGLEIQKNGEDWRLDNVEKAINEVKLYAKPAVRPSFDMNPPAPARDIRKLLEVAKADTRSSPGRDYRFSRRPDLRQCHPLDSNIFS